MVCSTRTQGADRTTGDEEVKEQRRKHENTQQDVTEDPGNEGIRVRTLLQTQKNEDDYQNVCYTNEDCPLEPQKKRTDSTHLQLRLVKVPSHQEERTEKQPSPFLVPTLLPPSRDRKSLVLVIERRVPLRVKET